jgi:hypothetical protein
LVSQEVQESEVMGEVSEIATEVTEVLGTATQQDHVHLISRTSTLSTATSIMSAEPAPDNSFNNSSRTALSSTSASSGVSFGTVRVHEHRLTLGDNPGVSIGVPLTLGWECDDSETYDLEAFERLSKDNNSTGGVHRLTRYKRELIASENHSRDSITLRKKEVRTVQLSRAESEQDKAARRVGRENIKKGLFKWFQRK